MSPLSRVILGGAVGVVAFDALACLASRRLGVAYPRAAVGSWLIYAVVGCLAGRLGGLRAAALGGAAMGLVDATLGWAVSWWIGPGRVAGGLTTTRWLATAVGVILIATVAGFLGGLGARLRVHS